MVRNLSENTLRAYEYAVSDFLAFADAHALIYPDQWTAGGVEAFLASLRTRRGASAATANARRYSLVTFFKFLEREGAVARNPAKQAAGAKTPQRLPDSLNADEQWTVLATLSRHRTTLRARDFAVVATGILGGLRVAELCALRLHALDLKQGTLKVVLSKGGKSRLLPVVPWLAVVLEHYLTTTRPALACAASPDTLFLQRDGRACTRHGLWRMIAAVVGPIIGRRAHPHMLRHSFASRALSGGASLPTLQRAMGHSFLNTTAIYLHISDPAFTQELSAALDGETPRVIRQGLTLPPLIEHGRRITPHRAPPGPRPTRRAARRAQWQDKIKATKR